VALAADAHGPGDRTWGLYAGLGELARATDSFAVSHPDVTAGALHGPDGGLIVLTNHGPARLDVPIKTPEGAVPRGVIRNGQTESIEATDMGIAIDGHDCAIVMWRPESPEQR